MKHRPDRPYRSFLIRCWTAEPVTSTERPHWRYALEAVDGGGERHGFNDLHDLMAYLATQVEERPTITTDLS